MQYLLYIIAIPFIFFNYKIIISDLKNKIIPNKYLIYLLAIIPLYYIYIYFNFPEINYLLFIWQIFLTLFISFILYYFWIWAAWDAKYLLILSLFIPYVWIVPFIWNIAILTIFYLLLYFIWFWIIRIILNPNDAKILGRSIKIDLNDKWKIYKNNKWWNTFLVILKTIILFLIIFITIRLIRLYYLKYFFQNSNNIEFMKNILERYDTYLLLFIIILFIWILYLFKILINNIRIFLTNKFNIQYKLLWTIFLLILATVLIIFIIYEYKNNSYEIKKYLFQIFTLYLWIYILIKIAIYSYNLTFWTWENYFIKVNNLKKWDIIEKKWLKDSSNIWNDIKLINNQVTNEDIKLIKKAYNNNQKNIKLIKTFSFAPYILLSFIITYSMWSLIGKIFKLIISYL